MQQVLCSNSDIQGVQKNAFLVESAENKIEDCQKYPFMDLSLWRE